MDTEACTEETNVITKKLKELSKKFTRLYLFFLFGVGVALFFWAFVESGHFKNETLISKAGYMLASILISTGGVGLLLKNSGPLKALKDLLDNYDIIEHIKKIDEKIIHVKDLLNDYRIIQFFEKIDRKVSIIVDDFDRNYTNYNNIPNGDFILDLEKSLTSNCKVTYYFIGRRATWVPLLLAKCIYDNNKKNNSENNYKPKDNYKPEIKIYIMDYSNKKLLNKFPLDPEQRKENKKEMLSTIEMFRRISACRAKVYLHLLDYDPQIKMEAFDNGEIYYYPGSAKDGYLVTNFHGAYKYLKKDAPDGVPRRPVYELLSSTKENLQDTFWEETKDPDSENFTLLHKYSSVHTNSDEEENASTLASTMIQEAKDLDFKDVKKDFIKRWKQYYRWNNEVMNDEVIEKIFNYSLNCEKISI